MPLYEYRCNDCDHIFDRIIKINEEKEIYCPKCGEKAKKVVSMPNTETILYGKEEAASLKEESKRMANQILNGDDNLAANILGEDKVK